MSISTGSAGTLLFVITMLIEIFSEVINIEVAKKVKFKLKLHDYIFLVNPNNIEFMKLLNKVRY